MVWFARILDSSFETRIVTVYNKAHVLLESGHNSEKGVISGIPCSPLVFCRPKGGGVIILYPVFFLRFLEILKKFSPPSAANSFKKMAASRRNSLKNLKFKDLILKKQNFAAFGGEILKKYLKKFSPPSAAQFLKKIA